MKDIVKLYEELRNLIDGGSESMTHADAIEQVKAWVKADEQPTPIATLFGSLPVYDTAPVQEPDAFLHDDGYWTAAKTDAGRALNDRLHFAGSTKVAVYTAPQPDRIAQLEAANANLFEQGQKMHKRIQELEKDCKIGAQEMVKAYEEIDNLKAQMFMHEPVTDEENERFSEDVSNFDGADPGATKYALEQFLKNRSLAARPRKAVRLSDADIHNADPLPHAMFDTQRTEFARAIEQAVLKANGVEP